MTINGTIDELRRLLAMRFLKARGPFDERSPRTSL